MRIRARTIWIVVVLVLVVEICLILWHISRPRVVARAVAPDGTEMCIIQRCDPSDAPFLTTGFVYRKPGQQWGWFYYDHEDYYWGKARIVTDTNAGTTIFYRGETPAVTFDWIKENYTLHRWRRTMNGTEAGRQPAGWSPEKQTP